MNEKSVVTTNSASSWLAVFAYLRFFIMSFVVILPTLQLILSRYVLLICFILGIFGCILNILVFLQKSLRSNACSVYMLAINIVNLIEIPYALVRVTVNAYLPVEHRFSSDLYCKIFLYFQHYLLNVVRTYTVLACIDRYVLCSTNARIRQFSSILLARKLVIIMTVVWLIIPLHISFYYGRILSGQCGVSGIYGIFFSIYSAIVTGGHLILMIIFSSLAIYNIRTARMRVQPTGLYSHHVQELRKKDFQMIKMLTGEVIAYVLTSAMFPIFTIYTVATGNLSKSSTRVAVEGFFAFLVPDFLVMVNPCTTFYVYLCASKTFRRICKHILLCRSKHNANDNANGRETRKRRRRMRNNLQTCINISRTNDHQTIQDERIVHAFY